MKNYYEILGISPTATQEEIKQAYHKLAKQYHPDINPNNNQAEEKLKEINESYNTLSDIDKKRDYDNRYNYYFSNNSDSSQSYNQAETDYIRNLKNKANNNDTEAQLELGNIYFYGRGVKENEQEAFYWFRKAAVNENMEALDFLKDNASKSPFAARELITAFFGLSFEKKVAEAVKALDDIASGGNEFSSLAQYYMGQLFFNSEVIEQDYKTAFKYFKQSLSNGYIESFSFIKQQAEKDNYIAQETLAEIYLDGIMTDKNKKEAFKWYAKAAENGSQKAFDMLNKYINRGDADAKDGLLELYIFSKNYKGIINYVNSGDNKAVNYIRNIFNGQDNETQFKIAQIYTLLKNGQEAVKWYIKAASNNHSEALSFLTKYNSIYNKEVEQFLAEFYYNKNNFKSSAQYYERLIKYDFSNFNKIETFANNGNEWFQNTIAEIYYQGKYGIQKDLEKAKYYYKQSADKNNEEAKKALVSVYISCNEFNEETIKLFREETKKDNNEASQALLKYCSSIKEINSEIVDITKEIETVNKFNPELEYKIGNTYFFGNQEIKQDYTTAFEWYLKAQTNGNTESEKIIDKALQGNNQYAQYVIGKYYLDRNNIEKGIDLIIKSANQQNQDSTKYLKNFIENCSVKEQYEIAQLIKQNKLPKQEIVDFIKLYETSSQNGYIESTKRLAQYYQNTDKEKSNSYYIKYEHQCIEKNIEIIDDIKLILADIYFTNNTHQNKEKALNYYIELAKEGNEKAKNFIENIDIKTLNDNELKILSKYYDLNIFVDFFGLKLYFFIKKHYIIILSLIILFFIFISIYVYIPKGTDFQKAEIYYERGNTKKAVELWLQSVKKGNIEAIFKLEKFSINSEDEYNLGNICYEKITPNKAIYWWSKSAQQGNQKALLKLKELAKNQNSDVQCKLGHFYYDKGNIEEAIYWYTKSSQNNNEEALTKLISLAKGGNYKSLLKLEELSKQGNIEDGQALYKLGIYFYDNEKIEQAIPLLTKSAQHNNKEALKLLAFLAQKGNNKVLSILENLANEGVVIAKKFLGIIYFNLAISEREKKIEIYEKITNLSRWKREQKNEEYVQLRNLEKQHHKKYLYYLEKSADLENAEAQNSLGWYYYYYFVDKEKANYWWNRCDGQGYRPVWFNAHYYDSGASAYYSHNGISYSRCNRTAKLPLSLE